MATYVQNGAALVVSPQTTANSGQMFQALQQPAYQQMVPQQVSHMPYGYSSVPFQYSMPMTTDHVYVQNTQGLKPVPGQMYAASPMFIGAGHKRPRQAVYGHTFVSSGGLAPPQLVIQTNQLVDNLPKAKVAKKQQLRRKKDTKSSYRGVFWNNQSKVWIASITVNGRKKHLGCFDSEMEAAQAYDREALKLKGALATVNFSDSAERLKAEQSSGIVIETTRHVRKRAEKTSKFRGVCWNKYNQSWKACIKVNGKNKHLGYFTNEIDAAKAYDKVSLQHRQEKAKLNFPLGDANANSNGEKEKVLSSSPEATAEVKTQTKVESESNIQEPEKLVAK